LRGTDEEGKPKTNNQRLQAKSRHKIYPKIILYSTTPQMLSSNHCREGERDMEGGLEKFFCGGFRKRPQNQK